MARGRAAQGQHAPDGANGRTSEQAPNGRWMTIHAACDLLGVDQSTLRRWSDAGKVPVFRTPGGHRRYAEADLLAMVGMTTRPQQPKVTHQSLTDRSLLAYEEQYLRGARERRWFDAYGASTQEEHRRLGRRLVDLAMRYAATSSASDERQSLLDEGRQIGVHYGRSGAEHGLSPAETLQAFLYFRYPLTRAVTSMIEDEEWAAKRVVRLFVEIEYFMDQVLTATIEANEQVAVAR